MNTEGYRHDREATSTERELRSENETLQRALDKEREAAPLWLDRAMRWLFGGAGVGVAGLVGFLLFSAFSSCAQSCSADGLTKGVVTNKHHRDAFSTTVFVTSGKVLVPVTTHYTELWWVSVADEGQSDDLTLSAELWRAVDVGDCWHGGHSFSKCTSATDIAGVGL